MTEARTLIPGRAEAEALVLAEPVSFWGGVDPATGQIKELYYSVFGGGWVNNIGNLVEGQGYIVKLNAAHDGFTVP